MPDLVAIAGPIAAVAAGLAGAGYIGRAFWRFVRSITRLADAIIGDKENSRPGLLDRLDGIETRLTRVEYQLHPNSGGSLFDKVSRIDEKMGGAGNEGSTDA